VLVRYPSADAAGAAATGARAALLGGSAQGVRDERGCWRSLAAAGRDLALVVDAASDALAAELLAQALRVDSTPTPEARP
jgi:hypothetical protein